MIIDYDLEKVYTKSVCVNDAGNCCLRCLNTGGEEWYISVQAVDGMLHFIKFGPVIDGISQIDWDYEFSHKKTKFSEKAINKELISYINDPRKEITEVVEITREEMFNLIPNNESFIVN